MKRTRFDFKFEEVKEHLSTLTDTKLKIKYLTEQIADYRQSKDWVHTDKEKTYFDGQCELEIVKLNKILALGIPEDQPSENVQTKHQAVVQPPILNNPIKWSGTQGQLVYLFELLGDANFLSADIDSHATARSHFADSDGKTFTALKQSKQNYLNSKSGKPKRAEELESLVNKAKAHKKA